MNNQVPHSALEDENRHSMSMMSIRWTTDLSIKIWKKKCATAVTMTRMDLDFHELYVAV